MDTAATDLNSDAVCMLTKAGLAEFASITTERTSFKLGDDISIDVDKSTDDTGSFSHFVVEVERLSSESTVDAVRSASSTIDRLVSSLPGVDPGCKAEGKVLSFMRTMRPEHLAHLVHQARG